jgi:hypothetical protein
MIKFIFTPGYEEALSKIENFIFDSTKQVELVDGFLKEHDEALLFVAENPKTPAVHPTTGDQSWIFGNGRYRFFFVVAQKEEELIVHLLHIIDNRQANLEIYPDNSLPTYEE